MIIENAKKNNGEFRDFLNNYNVIQLAVGVVIGNAVKDLTASIADNLLMPLIEIFTPHGYWRDWKFTLIGSDFKVGLFIASLLNFVIVALVVFLVIKKLLRLEVTSGKK